MPEYIYRGVDSLGNRVTGRASVANLGELRITLRGQGVRPRSIFKSNTFSKKIADILQGNDKPMPLETLVFVTRQLQVLINAGVPITQALELMSDQAADKYAKRIFKTIFAKVSSGSYFWEALNGFPRVFPRLYISLIRAGEASGSVDLMLKRLSRYLEDSYRLRRLMKSAMMYPLIVILIGIGVIVGMLMFVVPRFEDMLKQNNAELPSVTRWVLDASHFLGQNVLAITATVGIVTYIITRYFKSEEGRGVLHRNLFHIPLFGSLMQKAGVARFARTMQTLLASGVNLIDAIEICRATIDNAVLEDAVGKIRIEVEQGKTLGAVLGRLKVFPRMATQMISVGESTGNLDKMLDKVADFYEEEVETMVTGMTKLIEPIVLVLLGGMVGGLLIAMYLPIFKLAEGAGGG